MRCVVRLLAMALSCLAASCAPESAPRVAASGSSDTQERSPTAPNLAPELKSAPRRVIPGNAAAAEFIAPLLGPERIAALPEQVDAYSSYDFHSRGFENVKRFARYSAEALIALHPDLVVTHVWQAAETTSILRDQGTPVLVLRSSTRYDDVRATILLCARVFELEKDGERIVADLDRRVARLRERTKARAGAGLVRGLVYSNDGSGGWAAGGETTADTLLELAGLRNAAVDVGLKGHVGVDFEKLLAIDPDVIVVGKPARDETGSPTKSVLEATPALANLRALRERRIAVLSAALLSSDSQGLVDGAEALADALDAMVGVAEAKK